MPRYLFDAVLRCPVDIVASSEDEARSQLSAILELATLDCSDNGVVRTYDMVLMTEPHLAEIDGKEVRTRGGCLFPSIRRG